MFSSRAEHLKWISIFSVKLAQPDSFMRKGGSLQATKRKEKDCCSVNVCVLPFLLGRNPWKFYIFCLNCMVISVSANVTNAKQIELWATYFWRAAETYRVNKIQLYPHNVRCEHHRYREPIAPNRVYSLRGIFCYVLIPYGQFRRRFGRASWCAGLDEIEIITKNLIIPRVVAEKLTILLYSPKTTIPKTNIAYLWRANNEGGERERSGINQLWSHEIDKMNGGLFFK